MVVSIHTDGVGDFLQAAATLELAAGGLAVKASAIVAKTAADIVRDAQSIVVVDTGYLKNSIGFDMPTPFEANIGPTASYGRYIEEGTSRMGPRPYMRPAFERNIPLFEAAAAQLDGL